MTLVDIKKNQIAIKTKANNIIRRNVSLFFFTNNPNGKTKNDSNVDAYNGDLKTFRGRKIKFTIVEYKIGRPVKYRTSYRKLAKVLSSIPG
jgi:hypothetical protein